MLRIFQFPKRPFPLPSPRLLVSPFFWCCCQISVLNLTMHLLCWFMSWYSVQLMNVQKEVTTATQTQTARMPSEHSTVRVYMGIRGMEHLVKTVSLAFCGSGQTSIILKRLYAHSDTQRPLLMCNSMGSFFNILVGLLFHHARTHTYTLKQVKQLQHWAKFIIIGHPPLMLSRSLHGYIRTFHLVMV